MLQREFVGTILHWTLVELLLQRDFVGIHSTLYTGWAVATKRLCWHPFYIEHWLSCCYKETLLASILHWTLVELFLERDFVGIHSTLNTGWAVATKRLCWHPFYIEHWLSCCYKETLLATILHWRLVELLLQRDFVGTILHWRLVELLLQRDFVGTILHWTLVELLLQRDFVGTILHWKLVELLLQRDFVGIHSALYTGWALATKRLCWHHSTLNTGWAVATKRLCWHPFYIEHWLSCCYKETLLAPFYIDHWLSCCYKETLLASILHWTLVELLL